MPLLKWIPVAFFIVLFFAPVGEAQSPEYARSKKPAGYYLDVPNYYNGIRIPPGPPRQARPGYVWDRNQSAQGVQWTERAASRPYAYRIPHYYHRPYRPAPVIVEQPVLITPPILYHRLYW